VACHVQELRQRNTERSVRQQKQQSRFPKAFLLHLWKNTREKRGDPSATELTGQHCWFLSVLLQMVELFIMYGYIRAIV
jgi:hypothetical protein